MSLISVNAALAHRGRTGRAKWIDMSMRISPLVKPTKWIMAGAHGKTQNTTRLPISATGSWRVDRTQIETVVRALIEVEAFLAWARCLRISATAG